MPNLNDLFNRTGGLNGSNASPLGGVWQNQPTVWVEPTAGEVGLDGSKVTMRTSDPSLHTNSLSTASADQKVTLQFTPVGDNWQVIILLRANATTGAAYQLLFGPGAGGIGVYRRSSTTESWGGATQIGSSVNNPMTVSERGGHVLTFSVIGNAFSATIDGAPIALGTITDNTITAAGRAGFGGRSFTSDSISEDDETGGGDTTNPTLTGSITVSALTSTSYTLTWPAGSDNVAVTGYEVSLNGGTSYTSVGNVLTTNITGRTPSSTDAVRVRAFDAAGLRSTPALSTSVTLNAAPGTLTLASPLVNNTGEISGTWANATGIRLSVVNESTGASVLVVTGRATDASGVLTAPITDAAIVTGQTYRILPSWSGNAGLSQVLTAT